MGIDRISQTDRLEIDSIPSTLNEAIQRLKEKDSIIEELQKSLLSLRMELAESKARISTIEYDNEILKNQIIFTKK